MLKNDSKEDFDRLLSEIETLRQINLDLSRENAFLKAELARVRKSRPQTEARPSLTQFTLTGEEVNNGGPSVPVSMVAFGDKVFTSDQKEKESSEKKQDSLQKSQQPYQKSLYLVDKKADEAEREDRFNLMATSFKNIGGECFLFEELMLYGLGEGNGFKAPLQLFFYRNHFLPKNEEKEAAKESEDLLRFIFAREIGWKPVNSNEIIAELHAMLFGHAENRGIEKYVFTAHDLKDQKYYIKQPWTSSLNLANDYKYVCLKFNDLIYVYL